MTTCFRLLGNMFDCCSWYNFREPTIEQFSNCLRGNHPPKSKTPMPWIGFYVAAASAVCCLAMAADVFKGFRSKKGAFVCKYFSLDAATMALLAIATKMPMDLSTDMPSAVDQLTKLSSTALVTVAIANFMPSIGAMSDKEIFTNVAALGLLVIPMVVNVCIQLSTEVISYHFILEHSLVLFFMLLLFIMLVLTALAVETIKKHLELKYQEMNRMDSKNKNPKETKEIRVEKLKEEVKKYWLLAQTGSPQCAMARSVVCSASGAICFLTLLALVEAELRIFKLGGYYPLAGKSDYNFSTPAIVVIQTTAVLVGSVGPGFRWLSALKVKFSNIQRRSNNNHRTQFKIERYWIERLIEWKNVPLALQIRGAKYRKLVQDTKDVLLYLCLKVQIMNVFASKCIVFFSVILVSPFILSFRWCNEFKSKLISKFNTSEECTSESGAKPSIKPDLARYVLYLEGEEELPERTMKNIIKTVDRFISKGGKKKPKFLLEFLKKSTVSNGGSANFQNLRDCWSLPVVSLTSIAIATPNIEKHKLNLLRSSISEGLSYVRFVEESMDVKGSLVDIRNAAGTTWLGVEFHNKWLDLDLAKVALKSRSSRKILQSLADEAKSRVLKFKENMNEVRPEEPINWPATTIAANSMHDICTTLLQDCAGAGNWTNGDLFENLCVMIADTMRACLTNLPSAIIMKCCSNAIEKREEGVRQAALLLGETEDILEILRQPEFLSFSADQASCIDERDAMIDI